MPLHFYLCHKIKIFRTDGHTRANLNPRPLLEWGIKSAQLVMLLLKYV